MQSMVEGARTVPKHPLRRLRRHLPREERGRIEARRRYTVVRVITAPQPTSFSAMRS